MIKRIVKMAFEPDHTATFLSIFENTKTRIRAFSGCHHLELWRSTSDPNLLFTYSYWETEEALNNYRHSPLFKETWTKVKPLFSEKAQAWSIDVAAEL